MNLKRMKINFLGDSITQGHGTTSPDKIFHQIIKEKCEMACAYNYGVSGTRIARQTGPSEACLVWDLDFILRAEIMERNVDAVVVFGGTNDYGHGDARFGTLESEDIYTFCGAVNVLITKLENDFPNAKIIFMTPLHRVNETYPKAPDGKILSDYADAIRAICAKRHVSVIDLFQINPLDPTDAELVPDGLHPSDKGHEIMAQVIAEELLKL